jgi:antitoxin VapB
MISLSQETEALAKRLAAAQHLSVEEVIQQALEAQARAAGVRPEGRPRRRMTAGQMCALGAEIAALPVLDARSPNEIMDDLNAL